MRQTQVLASGTAFTSPSPQPALPNIPPVYPPSYLFTFVSYFLGAFSWVRSLMLAVTAQHCWAWPRGPGCSTVCLCTASSCHCPSWTPFVCCDWIHLYALHTPFSNLLLTLLKRSQDFLVAKFRDHTFSNMLHGLTCLSPGTPQHHLWCDRKTGLVLNTLSITWLSQATAWWFNGQTEANCLGSDQIGLLLAFWHWPNYIKSFCLSFSIYKMS